MGVFTLWAGHVPIMLILPLIRMAVRMCGYLAMNWVLRSGSGNHDAE